MGSPPNIKKRKFHEVHLTSLGSDPLNIFVDYFNYTGYLRRYSKENKLFHTVFEIGML